MKLRINTRDLLLKAAEDEGTLTVTASVSVDALFRDTYLPEVYELDIGLDQLLAENRQIAHLWGVEDVREVRPDLDADQAWAVLKRCEEELDSLHGLCWDDIERVASAMFGIPSERLGKCSRVIATYGDDLPESNLIDLLADAMHWCQANGHRFDDCLAKAARHFDAEAKAE